VAEMGNTRYDFAARRKSKRTGNEKGCWLYIPMEELAKTGVDLDGLPPRYRVWGGPRGRCVVQFYKAEEAAA
jgi:hypothetical protein